MIRLAIATMSKEKIEGIITGFCKVLNVEKSQIDILAYKSDSNVSDQPFDNDIYIGALNRVNNSLENPSFEYTDFDYVIGCEAGIETFCSTLHFNVQVICIYETKTKKYMYGKSSGWQIQDSDIQCVRKQGLDKYMRGKGLNTVSDLIEGSTRQIMVEDAIKNALYLGKSALN